MTTSAEKIKARILIPKTVVGILLILFTLTGAYILQTRAIEDAVNQRASGVNRLFKELMVEHSELMSGQINFIQKDPAFIDPFLAQDRKILFENALPLFEAMRSRHRITHFYFHKKDRTCFLRVHSPDRHGDLIDRFTMKEAVSNRASSNGIELGPLGTFTLRTVHPWLVDGKHVGHIELGMEVEHFTQIIKETLKLDLLVLIEKKYLTREGWEAGLKILNREGNWGLFEDFVVIDQTLENAPALNRSLRAHRDTGISSFSVEVNKHYYKAELGDLADASGRIVGEIVCLVDVTAERHDLQLLFFTISGLSLVVGGALFLFFFRYIGGIESRLVKSREALMSEIEVRRKSEQALVASEKQFRSIFEASKDAIISTDRNGTIRMINPAGMKIFGPADTEMGSFNFFNLYTDPAVARKFLISMEEKGFVRNFAVQLKAKNRKMIECLITATAKQMGGLAGYDIIVRDVTPFKKLEKKLKQIAATDFLTGINNRRSFTELATKEIKRSIRYYHPFSLIMLDIDHFKKINDTYGHSAGDQVLRECCGVCLDQLRESDIMGRIGGEEFAIALVECDEESAGVVAERIKSAISSHRVRIESETICFTVSLGVAGLLPDDDLESTMERADKALYEAKRNGRNQFRMSSMISASV